MSPRKELKVGTTRPERREVRSWPAVGLKEPETLKPLSRMVHFCVKNELVLGSLL